MHKHVLGSDVRVKQFSVEDTNRKGSFTNTHIEIRVPHTGQLSCFFNAGNALVLNPISINIKDPSEEPSAAQALVDQSMMMLNQVLLVTYDSLDDLLAVIECDIPQLWKDASEGKDNQIFALPIHKVIDQLLFNRIRDRLDAFMPGKFSLNVRGMLSFNNARLIPIDFIASPKLRDGFYSLLELGSTSNYRGNDLLINEYTQKGYPRGPMNNFDFRSTRMERVIGLCSWFKRAIERLPESCFFTSGRSRVDWVEMIQGRIALMRDEQLRLPTGFESRDVVIQVIKDKNVLDENPRYQKAKALGLGEAALNEIFGQIGNDLADRIQKELTDRLESDDIQIVVNCTNMKEIFDDFERGSHVHDAHLNPHVVCPQDNTLSVIMALKDLAQDPFYRQVFNPDGWFIEVCGWVEHESVWEEVKTIYLEHIQVRAGLNSDLFQPTDVLDICVKC